MPVHLDLVRQMVREGRDLDWVMEKVQESGVADPLADLLDSLASVVQDDEPFEVGKELSEFGEAVLPAVAEESRNREFQQAAFDLLVATNLKLAGQCEHGEARGIYLGTAAVFTVRLAELGLDAAVHLRRAVDLYERTRQEGFDQGTSYWASSLMNQANALLTFAEIGERPKENLEQAVRHYEASRQEGFTPNTPSWARSLMNQASALARLADIGEGSNENLEQAVRHYEASRQEGFTPKTLSWARSFMNQANALQSLADIGERPIENLEQAVRHYEASRQEGFTPNTPDWAKSLMNQANALQSLADIGERPKENLEQAVRHYEASRQEGFTPNTPDWARSLMNQANALQSLADIGERPKENLEQAVRHYEASRQEGFTPNTPDWASSLMNQANALQSLADIGERPIENLEQAVRLNEASRQEGFTPNTPVWAKSLMNQANALLTLAENGEGPKENLEQAVRLIEASRQEGFTPNTPDWATSLMNQANALQSLADIGERPKENLEQAVRHYEASRQEGFTPNTPSWARSLANEANAWHRLSRIETQPAQAALHRQKGQDRLRESLESGSIPGSTDWINRALTWSWDEPIGHARSLQIQAFIATVESLRTLRMAGDDRSQFLERFARLYGELILAEWDDRPGDALHTAHLAKNRTVLEELAPDLPEPGENADRQREYDELRRQEAQILNLEARPPTEETGAALLQAIQAYQKARLDYLSHFPSSIPGVEAVQEALAKLDPDAILVELIPTREGTLVYVHPRQGEQAVTMRIEWATHDWAVDLLNPLLNALNTFWSRERSAEFPGARKVIRSTYEAFGKLLAEIQAHLPQDGRTLVIAPHGYYSLVPWAAATWDGRALIERMPVVILPAATLLPQILRQTKAPNGVARFFAAAQLGTDAKLPHTNQEVKDSAALWGTEPTLTATCDQIWRGMAGAGVLHLSGHSFFDSEDQKQSAFECEDSQLTAEKVANEARLDDCNLVFLSSCESGGQAAKAIDSFAGLAYAFFRAGTPSLIAPLWFAYDSHAADFAKIFYAEWLKPGQTLGLAFQKAMLSLKNQNPDYPESWGAWQLMGGWMTEARVESG